MKNVILSCHSVCLRACVCVCVSLGKKTSVGNALLVINAYFHILLEYGVFYLREREREYIRGQVSGERGEGEQESQAGPVLGMEPGTEPDRRLDLTNCEITT